MSSIWWLQLRLLVRLLPTCPGYSHSSAAVARPTRSTAGAQLPVHSIARPAESAWSAVGSSRLRRLRSTAAQHSPVHELLSAALCGPLRVHSAVRARRGAAYPLPKPPPRCDACRRRRSPAAQRRRWRRPRPRLPPPWRRLRTGPLPASRALRMRPGTARRRGRAARSRRLAARSRVKNRPGVAGQRGPTGWLAGAGRT